MIKFLTALPVFNEVDTVDDVLNLVTEHSKHVVVIDDGSTDGTAEALASREDVTVITHTKNAGYGAALMTAFAYAVDNQFDAVVTIDCDGQHEPQRIRDLVDRLESSGADIVSGSRYLKKFDLNSTPPVQRQWINQQITQDINDQLGFALTDAFCGFKAYRTSALKQLSLTETGYAMPLELWVQAACHELKVVEMAVPLIYLDESRSFGGDLDDGATRLNYYHDVIRRSVMRLPSDCSDVQARELAG